jgi:hypothetical protein
MRLLLLHPLDAQDDDDLDDDEDLDEDGDEFDDEDDEESEDDDEDEPETWQVNGLVTRQSLRRFA